MPDRRRGGQIVFFFAGLLAAGAAGANPQGAQIAAGTVAFATPNPQTLEITNSPSAILNWQAFDIGVGETTRFIQQDAASAVLNRVVTQNASEIFGNLVSNGRVFLINPTGILIGRDAVVDTAGLVMSTLQMSDADFVAGRLRFEGDENSGAIENHGYIKSGPGGEVILIAPSIVNAPDGGASQSGLIESEGGELILAAGHAITIASLDDPDIIFDVQAPEDEAINLGRLLAEGGSVGVFAGSIRHSGEINADSLTFDPAGRIVLAASNRVVLGEGSVTTASGEGAAGNISVSAGGAPEGGRIYQMGAVRADGNTGGDVSVQGERILASGRISARGEVDGGHVALTATDQVMATSNSEIDVAGAGGQGGSVAIDGGKSVYTSGYVRATGMTGGSVQVLGDDTKLAAATVDASGVAGGGRVRVGGGFQGGEDLPAADRTEVNAATVLKADARIAGNGGSVVVWADGETRYAGVISAHGGSASGNGGTVEVSGKEALGFNGVVDVSADAGTSGSLLLDPKNVRFTSEALTGAPIGLLDPNPGAGNNFGNSFQQLFESGDLAKFIVYDSLDDFGGTDAGAVYLFRASDGALLSTLTGGQAGDRVGNLSVQNLTTGVNVLRSTLWNGSRGAVTLYDVVNGTSGVVDASNSLVGVTANDQVGGTGVSLLSGNVVIVRSPQFDGTRGALTFGTTTSLSGPVSASNSLLGANVGDFLSNTTLTNLFNGNFVQRSIHGGAGAFTFINPAAPNLNVVSSTNSLVGGSATDAINNNTPQFLGGSTWAIRSPLWDADAINTDAGAVTLFDSSNGHFSGTANAFAGVIGPGNSLVGSTLDDQVGGGGIAFAAGSSYAFASPSWDNGGALTDAGAITWFTLGGALNGAVSGSNSLVGSNAFDRVGLSVNDAIRGFSSNGIFDLFNGNALLKVPTFNSGRGSLTFLNGAGPLPLGPIGAGNSLVGVAANDSLGNGGLQSLSFNQWAILSSLLDVAGITDAGAVTMFDSGTGTFFGTAIPLAGSIDGTNSLVGSQLGDQVGLNGVAFVAGSTYGVFSSLWDNGAQADAGAATWFTLGTALTGPVTAVNSLMGVFGGDHLGATVTDPLQGTQANGIFSLFNGNAVLELPLYNNGAGSLTFLNGGAALPVGGVSAGNSLVGMLAGDTIGSGGLQPVSGSIWALRSPSWDVDGSTTDAGAVTFFDADTGLLAGAGLAVGVVSAANSLVGGTLDDQVGSDGIAFVAGTVFAVYSSQWDDVSPGVVNAGAATWFVPGNAVIGLVTDTNSLVGGFANDAVGADVFDPENGTLTNGVLDFGNGKVVIEVPNFNGGAGAVTWIDPAALPVGAIGSGNSLVGTGNNDAIGRDGIRNVSGSTYAVMSSSWDLGGPTADVGAVTFFDAGTGLFSGTLTPFAGVVGAGNSLIGSTLNDNVGNGGIRFVAGSTYGVFSPLWDNGAASDAGAATWFTPGSVVAGPVTTANSLVGAFTNDGVGTSVSDPRYGFEANGIFNVSNGNALLEVPTYNVTAGAVVFLNGSGALPVGVIDSSRGLIGNAGDRLGSGGLEFISGNSWALYSPLWDASVTDTDAGAVTTFDSTAGHFDGTVSAMIGTVDATNSLVGSTLNDQVGSNFISFVSGASNYGVFSPLWDDTTGPVVTNAGAATWFTPGSVLNGAVSQTNSLVGAFNNDILGSAVNDPQRGFSSTGVFSMFNGNAVLRVQNYNTNAGAVTFLSGTAALPVGPVLATNSLIGNAGDQVGSGGLRFLGGSSWAVLSPLWDASVAATSAGAISFFDSLSGLFSGTATPLAGVVSGANSLVGSTLNDSIGGNGFVQLDNGTTWGVLSSVWDDVGAADAGAVTWFTLGSAVAGAVGAGNSLVGGFANDRVGLTLSNLSFSDRLLVRVPNWNANRGALSVINPASPTTGAVSAANSLVGSSAGDLIGNTFQELTTAVQNRGLFVVRSSTWNGNAGAVTVVNSLAPTVGAVSEFNSLVGRTGDQVGNASVSQFSTGSLLVRSTQWSDGLGATLGNFGAATMMLATGGRVTPTVGFVSAANSLVGSHPNDSVGNGSFNTFTTGIALRSPNWNSNAGAVSFINTTTGRTGVLSDQNSLAGVLPNDFIGSGGITSLGGDRFIVRSPLASVNGLANAGRLDIVDGATAQAINGDIGFGASPGGDLLISIASLLSFLNAGGELHVQASNDIFISLGQSINADSGSLFLQAGRSIEISADLILSGGTLSMIANDPGADPAFRDTGDGNITIKTDTTPVRVMATTLKVEAQNIILDAGDAPGAFTALIGLGTAEVHAHGSGLISLNAGTSPGSTLPGGSSVDILNAFVNDPTNMTAPAAFILGRNALTIIADNVELTGGGSEGAFAAIASYGDFSVEAINISLLAGLGLNADAVLLGLGGVADLTFTTCELCKDLLLGDPLIDSLSQGGVFISGIFEEPTINAILAMLDNDEEGTATSEDDEDDDEDDDDEGEAKCP